MNKLLFLLVIFLLTFQGFIQARTQIGNDINGEALHDKSGWNLVLFSQKQTRTQIIEIKNLITPIYKEVVIYSKML
jgi:hypothetical protein